MSNVVLNILSEFRGKAAFKDADTALSKLNKGVSKLARNLGLAFGTAAVINFGKESVKAFASAEKSNVQLASSVKNLGFAFAQSNISNFLDKISASSGIAGETLNSAFQALLSTSGSVLKSQEMLKLALDVSAGSTVDLIQVSNDLAQAYVGNTKGLKKYNLGLSQAELKVASFTDLTARLNQQFGGANQKFLETYAGKMQILGEAAGNAQEIIGAGLVDALGIIGGKGVDDINAASKAMGGLATATADVIRGQARVIENLSNIGGGTGGKLGGYVKGYFKEVLGIQALEDLGKSTKPRPTAGRRFMGGAQANLYSADAAASKKFQANQKKFQDALLASQKKQTAEQKKQAALKKAGTVFDMEQIQIIAALKRGVSEDEKRRLELQLAILNDNDVLATKLSEELLKSQDSTGKLYQYFLSIGDTKIKNPFAFLDDWIIEFQKKLSALSIPDLSKPSTYQGSGLDPALAAIGIVAGYGANVPQTGSPSTIASSTLLNGSYGMQSTAGFVDTSSVTGTNVKVYVSGSVVTEQELIDAIQAGLQSNSLSGAPSQIGRIAGMFG